MPGAPPTSPAPFRVADTLELPSVECVRSATATWTFGRRPDEVPAARGAPGESEGPVRGRDPGPFGENRDRTWHDGKLSADACHLCLLCHHPG